MDSAIIEELEIQIARARVTRLDAQERRPLERSGVDEKTRLVSARKGEARNAVAMATLVAVAAREENLRAPTERSVDGEPISRVEITERIAVASAIPAATGGGLCLGRAPNREEDEQER